MINKNITFVYFFIFMGIGPLSLLSLPDVYRKRSKPHTTTFHTASKNIKNVIKTMVETVTLLHWNLLSFDSFKIGTAAFPFYGVTRGFDEKIQKNFFDHHTKKNIHNPPKWCSQLARFSITVPIIYFATQAFLARDTEFRITCQTFLLGLPFVLIAKDIIKKLQFKANLRPFHETLSPHKRCGGGFPSGHMAEAVFTASLFGMRFGRSYGIPLALLAGFLGSVFVACNRHYVSQVVAGATFGTLYAFAANKVVDYRLKKKKEPYQVDFSYENQKPGISVSFNF